MFYYFLIRIEIIIYYSKTDDSENYFVDAIILLLFISLLEKELNLYNITVYSNKKKCCIHVIQNFNYNN